MLVLTRKLGQSIVIGDEVEVVVLEVRGEQVRIGRSEEVGLDLRARAGEPLPVGCYRCHLRTGKETDVTRPFVRAWVPRGAR